MSESLVIVLLSGLLLFQLSRANAARNAAEQALMPSAGDYLPTFITEDVDGNPLSIADPPLRQTEVLVLFSSSCRFCIRNAPHWNEMVRIFADHERISVVFLSRDQVQVARGFLEEHGLLQSARAAHLSEPRHQFLIRADVVPQIIVVRSGGRVAWAHKGLLGAGDSSWQAMLAAVEIPGGQMSPR